VRRSLRPSMALREWGMKGFRFEPGGATHSLDLQRIQGVFGECVAKPRRGAKQGLWRLMGALNPFTGQVTYLDNYIIGREKVIACYGQLVQAYPKARRLYAIQDNWSIHKHPDVVEALKAWPQIEPVWLPTY